MRVCFNQNVDNVTLGKGKAVQQVMPKIDFAKLENMIVSGTTKQKRMALASIKGINKNNGNYMPGLRLVGIALDDAIPEIRHQAVNVLSTFADTTIFKNINGSRERFDIVLKKADQDPNKQVSDKAREIKLKLQKYYGY